MKFRNGFTLIELLVVVLIIGILAAIALPQYKRAVERTYTAEAVQNMATLEKAIDVWVMENGGFPSSRVNFIGTEANGKDLLNIDVTQGMECDTGTCQTEHFNYNFVDCFSNTCRLFFARPRNGRNGTKYHLWSYKSSPQARWRRQCEYEEDFEYICRGLEPLGFERIACC